MTTKKWYAWSVLGGVALLVVMMMFWAASMSQAASRAQTQATAQAHWDATWASALQEVQRTNLLSGATVQQGTAALDQWAQVTPATSRSSLDRLRSAWLGWTEALQTPPTAPEWASAGNQLHAALDRALPSLRAQSSTLGSPALNQALEDLGAWDTAAQQWSRGARPEMGVLAAHRQRLEQGLRQFASSAEAQQTTALTQGWRAVAQVWTVVQPLMDERINAAQANPAPTARDTTTQAQAVEDASTHMHALVNQVAPASAGGVWLMGVLALALMGLWAWRLRQTVGPLPLGTPDEDEQAMVALLEHIEAVRQGNWTERAEVSSAPVGALADAFNRLLNQWQSDWQAVADASQELTQRLNQHQQAHQAQNQHDTQARQGQDQSRHSLRQERAMRDAHESQRQALAADVAFLEQHGQVSGKASDDLGEHWQRVRSHIQESEVRAHRTQDAWAEVAQLAHTLHNVAQQSSVLAVHASVMAAKAGERGAGFRRVSENMRDLSDQAMLATNRVQAVLKTAQSEGSAALVSLTHALHDTDEGARLTEVNDEAWHAWAEGRQNLLAHWADWAQGEQAHAAWFEQWAQAAGQALVGPSEPVGLQDVEAALAQLQERLRAFTKGGR